MMGGGPRFGARGRLSVGNEVAGPHIGDTFCGERLKNNGSHRVPWWTSKDLKPCDSQAQHDHSLHTYESRFRKVFFQLAIELARFLAIFNLEIARKFPISNVDVVLSVACVAYQIQGTHPRPKTSRFLPGENSASSHSPTVRSAIYSLLPAHSLHHFHSPSTTSPTLHIHTTTASREASALYSCSSHICLCLPISQALFSCLCSSVRIVARFHRQFFTLFCTLRTIRTSPPPLLRLRHRAIASMQNLSVCPLLLRCLSIPAYHTTLTDIGVHLPPPSWTRL